MKHEVIFPDGLDDYDYWEIEQKGWLDIDVIWNENRIAISFFDKRRLEQEITAELGRTGHFVARALIVVPSVTRSEILHAIEKLAERDFVDLL